MKGTFIAMVAALLLAAGCASQSARPGVDPAPSQAAAGSGWSVPPGSGNAGSGKTAADNGTDESTGSGEQTDGNSVAGLTQPDHTGSANDYERETPVKPIVPAFPDRRGEERVAQLDRVYFGFDRWDISAEMAAVLDRNADWLTAHPDVPVKVEGHTDERGSAEYNLSLGERRARAVRQYLLEQGVDPARLDTLSYGEEVPMATGKTEAAYAKNRRVEFSVDRAAAAARAGNTAGTN